MTILFNKDQLRDKIYGCWLGKNIGGTLGGPFECRMEIQNVTGYTTKAGEPLPNDDLDLQLVWLKALVERGAMGINAQTLGEYWLNYVSPPWGEYGICKMNMRVGLLPPLSGTYNNDLLKNSNGAWIRSEIWACITPGFPDVAIRFAYEDASVDHGGAEGMYAALFTAAVESAAFVISDRYELIRIGLSKIPADCRVARAIRTAMTAYEEKVPWQEARQRVVNDSVPEIGWFQAPANIGFVIIGWLYGEGDFGKSLCTAVNCGDDTDCTAATLGAILGIIAGKSGIPQEWVEPLGDRIITIAIDQGSDQSFWPRTLARLTDMVFEQIAPVLTTFKCPARIVDGETNLNEISMDALTCRSAGEMICRRSAYAVSIDFIHTRAFLDYGRDPVLRSGEPFRVSLHLESRMPDHHHYEILWHLPPGLRVLPSPRCETSFYDQHLEQFLILRGQGKPHSALIFDIVADEVSEPFYRGILEIRAHGRPNIGFLPVLFLNPAPKAAE